MDGCILRLLFALRRGITREFETRQFTSLKGLLIYPKVPFDYSVVWPFDGYTERRPLCACGILAHLSNNAERDSSRRDITRILVEIIMCLKGISRKRPYAFSLSRISSTIRDSTYCTQNFLLVQRYSTFTTDNNSRLIVKLIRPRSIPRTKSRGYACLACGHVHAVMEGTGHRGRIAVF